MSDMADAMDRTDWMEKCNSAEGNHEPKKGVKYGVL